MVQLLIFNVTYHTPQNRVSDIITHVTLNTISNALREEFIVIFHGPTFSQSRKVYIQYTSDVVWPTISIINSQLIILCLLGDKLERISHDIVCYTMSHKNRSS
jgi:hypothetical protein